ncbi:LytTR family DNA-binding domain-containing protein [Dokdonella soli]|uniref:LytTR family DNA-binding domain-containing protein n=1 Tax=Dokdonella soli TaxID=529810 RepID=A0ABN1IPH4_9GAMM
MRVLVVDDEPLARERLAAMLAEIEGTEVVGMAGNGHEALGLVGRLAPDLVLLDIRMPVMDGLEAARHLGELEAPPSVIFCTAFQDHALAAFDANAVDYLVKPVRDERLRAALDKARRLNGAQAREIGRAIEPGRARTHLCARVRGSLVLVPIADIDYLLAEDKYVVVHHTKGEVLIEEPLKSLEDEFEGRFVRIHRNCLVALAKLSGLTRAPDGRLFANVEGVTAKLEVSRRNLPALRRLVRSL